MGSKLPILGGIAKRGGTSEHIEFAKDRDIFFSSPLWNISGTLVQSIEIEEEETQCSSENQEISLYVAKRFMVWQDAMDICDKIDRKGTKLTEFAENEIIYQRWHKEGKLNQVYSKLIQYRILEMLLHCIHYTGCGGCL